MKSIARIIAASVSLGASASLVAPVKVDVELKDSLTNGDGDLDKYGVSRAAYERIAKKEAAGEQLTYYERSYIVHARRNEAALRRRLERDNQRAGAVDLDTIDKSKSSTSTSSSTLSVSLSSDGSLQPDTSLSASYTSSDDLERRLDDDVLATPRRLPSVTGVPSAPCTREGQCSGKGTCNAQDICVCDWMWEGNNCDVAIKDQKFVFHGDDDFDGLKSWQFILAFGLPLAIIPCVFCCMVGHFYKHGYFEEL